MAQFGHLVSGAAWSVAGKIIQFLLGLVTLAVVARLVGPAEYGIYALGWLVLGLFDIVIGGAPTDALVQRREVSRGHFNATFWVTLAIALGCWLLVWLTAEPVSAWLQGGEILVAILPIRAVIFVFRAIGVCPTAGLMRESRFRELAQVEVAASVLANVVGLAMALGGAGIWSLVAMEVLRAVAVCIGTFALARWRPGLAMQWRDFTDLLAFNVATWGSWGLIYARGQFPRLLIGASLGPQAVGFYSLAQRLCDQLHDTLMVPIYNVIQAGVARNQDDREAAARLALGTLRASGIVMTPLFLGLAGIAPVLVPAVFGADWRGAVPIVQLLMGVGILNATTTVDAAVIRGMGKPQWEMVAELFATVCAALLIGAAVHWGLTAAAVGLLLGTLALVPVEGVFVRRLTGLGLRAQLEPLLRLVVAGAVMAGVLLALIPVLESRLPAPLTIAVLLPVGALVDYLALRITLPSAARLIEQAVRAALRGDVGAIRSLLGGVAR